MGAYLPSIAYEPYGELSLFERWEAGITARLQAPLGVRDELYRSQLVEFIGACWEGRGTLFSVGAGNGCVEVLLAHDGWDVLASDPAESALRLCAAKGLATRRFALMADRPTGLFDVIYCDGVMGHLWNPKLGSTATWSALAELGHGGSMCVVSNDLSDDDETTRFAVRGSSHAEFYRPPRGSYANDALATERWTVVSERIYQYERSGVIRRREILAMRLLADEWIQSEDFT